MTITTRRVTGPIVLPDGSVPANGRVIVALSGWDREDGQGVMAGPVTITLDEDGVFDADLWCTDTGENGRVYTGLIRWFTGAEWRSQNIQFDVPSGTGDLAFAPIWVVGDLPQSTQADALAQCLAAAAQTALDRVATGDDREVVEQIADRIDLGEMDAAVAATAADRVQTTLDRTAAQTARAGAETARDQAQTARDAAIAAGSWNYTPADAAALAAITGMTAGQTALVVSTMHLWRYSGSAWVDMGISPLDPVRKDAKHAISLIDNGAVASIVGSVAQMSGSSHSGKAIVVAGLSPWVGGTLKSARVVISDIGSGALELAVFKIGGTNAKYTVLKRVPVTIGATGVVQLLAGADFALEQWPGGHIGVISPVGGASVVIGTGAFSMIYTGDPGTIEQTYSGWGAQLQLEFTTVQSAAAVEAQARSAGDQPGYVAREIVRAALPSGDLISGPVAPVSVAELTAANSAYLFAHALSGRLVTSVDLFVSEVGNGVLELCYAQTAGNPQVNGAAIAYRQPVQITSTGWQRLVAGRDFSAFEVPDGLLAGFISPVGGVRLGLAYGAGGPGTWVYSGDPGSAQQTYSPAGLVQINFTLTSQPVAAMLPGSYLPWRGAKAVALGDSITIAYSGLWFPNLQRTTGISTIVNRAMNGQVLAGMLGEIQAGDFTDAKLCLIGTGVNDWHHGSATIGAWGDAASANTIYGAIRKLIEGVYAQNPLTVPVFWGPFNSGQYTTGPAYGAANANGLTVTNVTDAMRDACGRHGVPFFETQRLMGVNDLNLTTHLWDNLHPTALCGARLGNMLGQFINRVQPML